MPTEAARREFAAQLNAARVAQHLSVRAVARLVGVPATTMQGWLSGAHLPSPALQRNYRHLLKCLGFSAQVPEALPDQLPETVTETD